MDRKKLLLKKEKGNVGFYIVVMILFIIMAFISTGIDEYHTVIAAIAESEKMKPQGAAEKVRLLLFCENVLEELEWK